ncbi:MAG: hypothetical protein V1809_15765 [Planctomycetota bacterium]
MAERMCWEMDRSRPDGWSQYTLFDVFRSGDEFGLILVLLFCWGGWLGIRQVIKNGYESVGKSARRLRWLAWCAVTAILVSALGVVTGGIFLAAGLRPRCGVTSGEAGYGILLGITTLFEGGVVSLSMALLHAWLTRCYFAIGSVSENSVGQDKPWIRRVVLGVLWVLTVICVIFLLYGRNEKICGLNPGCDEVGYGGVFGLIIGVIALAGILLLCRSMESSRVHSETLHGVLFVAILVVGVGFLGALSKLVQLIPYVFGEIEWDLGYVTSQILVALLPLWEGLVAALYFTFAYVYLRNRMEDANPAGNPPVGSARQG